MSITLDSRWESLAKHLHSFMGLIKRPTLSCTLVLGGQSQASAELAFNPELQSCAFPWHGHWCHRLVNILDTCMWKVFQMLQQIESPPTSYRCGSPSQPAFPFSVWHTSLETVVADWTIWTENHRKFYYTENLQESFCASAVGCEILELDQTA